ncbi:hypothetical protein HDZ31DRAFT_28396 [Schizophyllum fasciatum]
MHNDQATLRKLVVLDLNGTLVVRSRAGRDAHVPPPSDPYITFAPRSNKVRILPIFIPAPRIVYSRPFLRAFQQFLTHPSTRSWLDVMVWSSAQPHSIDSMVAHAFPGDARQALCAVWTRKDLGLSEKEYFNKTPTTKDLSKVWRAMERHSGKTTVLVDDSVLKAHLQPFNHLCLPEYTRQARAADLSVGAAPAQSSSDKKKRKKQRKKKNQKKEQSVSMDPAANDVTELSSRLQAVSVAEPVERASGLPRREGSRSTAKSPLRECFDTPTPDDTTTPAELVHDAIAPGTVDPRVPAGIDSALLAVTGVISTLKNVGDVARWFEEGHITRPPRLVEGGTGAKASNIDHGQALWFHDADIVRAWAQEGISVLDALGIEVAHGIQQAG